MAGFRSGTWKRRCIERDVVVDYGRLDGESSGVGITPPRKLETRNQNDDQ